MKRLLGSFTKFEIFWLFLSLAVVTVPFFLTGNREWYYLAAGILGVVSLTFTSKGNVLGEFLMVAFSILYGIISFSFAYYGEMITYLGMTLPISAASIVAWMRHPSDRGHSEVEIASLGGKDYRNSFLLGVGVTVPFYFILRYFHTPNLITSSLSVFTSFAAVWLTAKRSPFYALAYAANDIVLIILWILAAGTDKIYWAMVACFTGFLMNDIYGLFNWKRMQKRQKADRNNMNSDTTV